MRGGSVLARREKDGQLNWLKLLVVSTNTTPASTSAAGTNASPSAAAPWRAVLDELNLEGFSVTAEDRVPATAAQIGLDDLRVKLTGVSSQTNAPVTANIDFKWRAGGTVHVEANGTLLPPAGEAKLAVTKLALPPIQPYVEEQARLVLTSGELNVNGQARYSPGNRAGSEVQFIGDVSIANFASIDTIAYHDFAKWEDLGLHGIQFALHTNGLSVEEVKFRGLETSLVISSNGQMTVQALLKQKPSASSITAPTAAASSEPAPASEPFPVKVAALVFDKCSFNAADQSSTPRFSTRIEEINGTIRDLTLPALTRAGVDIRGKVSALAPFEISGSLTPDAKNPFVDLKLSLKNDDLTPFTPYTEKYAGHPLNKGKLSFDLRYLIENRNLQASNVIAIDQFTLGPRNASTNATKLPVKLAVALLKDRNGRIDLDLPVHGSLDDPKFNIGALVWKAISNILLKAATSPFSLLGAIVGGGEELQYVDFAPGAATLDGAQTNKLDTLAKALYERPALNLEISASVDPAPDRERLSLQKLRDKIKSLRVRELTESGSPVPPLSELKLDPADYERLLRKAYKDTFNLAPERAIREAQQAAAATNAQAAAPTTAPAAPAIAPSAAPRREIAKGAALLMQAQSATPAATPASKPLPAPAIAPAKPKDQEELVLEEMEQRFMAASPATDDDLLDLAKQRAASVQKFLLDTGKVTAERLFLIAPKPVDPTVKGATRATFSLD
jgi:hypothetical protein